MWCGKAGTTARAMRAVRPCYQPLRDCGSGELRMAPLSQEFARVGTELRMVSPDPGMTLPAGTATSYVIDGQNRRVGKKVNGVLVDGFFYRNQLQPAAWLDGTGAVKATFVYGLHPNVPEYMVQGTTTY